MGASSSTVIGYKYFTSMLLFIGNPIERLLGINFDKRGWHVPFTDEAKNVKLIGTVKAPTLFGENEGGVEGEIHLRLGTSDQEVVPFFDEYMFEKGLVASAYPYYSYLAFKDFYVGNSNNIREMLLWPKRINVREDGREQWYVSKAEIPNFNVIESPAIEYLLNSNIRLTRRTASKHLNSLNSPTFSNWYTATPANLNFANTEDSKTFTLGGSGSRDGGYSLPTRPENYSYSCKNIIEFNKVCALYIELSIRFCSLDTYVDFGETHIIGDVEITTDTQHSDSWYEYKTKTFKMTIITDKSLTIFARALGAQTNPDTPADKFHISCYLQDLIVDIDRTEVVYESSSDMNAIHAIREILTDDTAMNKPESLVNDENFRKAADWIYDEGFGISAAFENKSCTDAINEICGHIEAGIRVNRQTGLYEMVLFRDGWFEENEIHTISERKIKNFSCEPTDVDDVINLLNVSYYDRENIKTASFPVAENGLIKTLQTVNEESIDLKYFSNIISAQKIANWKLKQLSTPVFKGSFSTAFKDARKWNRYDLIRLPWSKRWDGTILVRINSINIGGPKSHEVKVEFIEVVSSEGALNTTINVDEPIIVPTVPVPCNSKVFELGYYDSVHARGEREFNLDLVDIPELGFTGALAEKPQNNSLNAALYVLENNEYGRYATVNYVETARLDENIDRITNVIKIKQVGDLDSVQMGTKIYINDEMMVFEYYDASTNLLTVKRGAEDLIPKNHNADSILYFADDVLSVDRTTRVFSDQIEAKVVTTTPSGVLAFEDADTHEIEFKARSIRPYPPANVKINDEYWPESIDANPMLTWSDRNRLQQTGGEPLSWYEGSVTKEEGVTYHYQIKDELENVIDSGDDVGSGLILDLEPADFFPSAKLALWSERNGIQSLERVEILLISEVGLLNGFLESIYAQNEYVNLKASLTNHVPISSLTVVDGTLPTGLSIIGTNITGSCSTQGTYTFTLESTDILTNIVQKTFTVKVQGVLWSQLTFDGQNMTDRVAGNTWSQGSGNTFVQGLYDGSDYALKMGGSELSTMVKTMTQSGNFSIAVTVNVPAMDQINGFVFLGSRTSNSNRENLYIATNGELRAYRQGASSGTTLNSGFYLEAGKTYRVGYDKSGNNRRLFVDGVLVASDVFSATVSNTSNVYLGLNRYDSNQVYSKAILDNVVISTGSSRFM
ncbi:hypothetical protein G9F32_03175 [Acinetobacter sp. 194]|uniref:LamG-like jellyroll fold domain-containing protein n=1 Tax=Acinetobacter shaoyimingii TaxID=2715164 RepID=UPI001407E66E|nr:LamG-like jellyroll fold domain-containing protein [Acinetobacter shaoyimingii]NHB57035.1 hypothetical protein [Acinetobacter shaoyimingii]